MIIELPFPPSVNTYWRHISRGAMAGRTLISEAGRNYRKAVIRECGVSVPLRGRLHATIMAYPPDRRRRDLDNLPKAILDALTHAGVYLDDEQIDRLLIERHGVSKPGRVSVEIVEITGDKS